MCVSCLNMFFLFLDSNYITKLKLVVSITIFLSHFVGFFTMEFVSINDVIVRKKGSKGDKNSYSFCFKNFSQNECAR